jgi:hypothetical protein
VAAKALMNWQKMAFSPDIFTSIAIGFHETAPMDKAKKR